MPIRKPDVLSSWLAQLESGHRRAILERLAQGPSTLPQLAEMLGLIPQTAHRHVQSLRNAGLVEGGEGGYQLTRDALLVLEQTSGLRTLARLRAHVEARRIEALPPPFRARLGNLASTRLLQGAFGNVEEILAALTRARLRVWVMATQPLSAAVPLMARALSVGADVRILVPPEHLPGCAAFQPLRPRLRVHAAPPAGLLVTEREAFLGLLDRSGGESLGEVIVGDAPDFVGFARDLFDDAWRNSSAATLSVNASVDAPLSPPRA